MAARPCSYPVSVLKKVITEKRKQKGFNNPSRGVLDNLLDEHRFLLQAEGIHDIGELMGGTVKQKRAVWQRIKTKYHPPVSKLTVSQLIQLIYATNKHLKYDYDSALLEHAKKKVVTHACEDSEPPDFNSLATADALPKRKVQKPTPKLANDDDLDQDFDQDDQQPFNKLTDSEIAELTYHEFRQYINELRANVGKKPASKQQMSAFWRRAKDYKSKTAKETTHTAEMRKLKKQEREMQIQEREARKLEKRDKEKAARKKEAQESHERMKALPKIPKKKKPQS